MTVLVIAEHDNHSLKAATLHTIAAGLEMGGALHVLVAGFDCGAVARAPSGVQGVTKVVMADAPHLADGLAEAMAAQALDIAKEYSHILAPDTAFGRNIAPRIAAKLDVAQVSGITSVVSADTFERPIYAGNAVATVQSIDLITVITVRATAFEAVPDTGGNAPVDAIAAAAAGTASRLVGRERQSTRVSCRATIRSDRRERSLHPTCISRWESPGRSSIWPG